MVSQSHSDRLRELLMGSDFLIMPCCYDGLTAKLVEEAGFLFTFMSGFGVSAVRLGLPDTGLISYGEMVDQLRNICSATKIPVIGDGDTGYGNAVNVKRTVHGYIQAGAAGIMIEDQKSPKRCGHTRGKDVIDQKSALLRMRAVMEARDEARTIGKDIVVVARTDAREIHGLDEAIERGNLFYEMGADIIFIEAPRSEAEMERICTEVVGIKMANMVEHGVTPVLPPDVLASMGFKIGAYPLTLLSAATHAMKKALDALANGNMYDQLLDFKELQELVGFPQYNEALSRLENP